MVTAVSASDLSVSDDELVLDRLRQLKNQVIGHVEGKDAYLNQGIIPCLLEILVTSHNVRCQVEAAYVLCSFAYGTDESVSRLLQYPLVDYIIEVISKEKQESSDERVVICLRILVTVMKSHPDPRILKGNEKVISILMKLLSEQISDKATDQACQLVQLLTVNPRNTELLLPLSNKLVGRVSTLLKTRKVDGGIRPSINVLERAVGALAHIISEPCAKQLLEEGEPGSISAESFIEGILLLTRDRSPATRLVAAELLSKLQRYTTNSEKQQAMLQPLLPTLVPLLHLLGKDARVSFTLANVCRDDKNSAGMAVEVGVVKQLITTLKNLDFADWRKSEIIAYNLLAVAGIAMHHDNYRIAVIEADGLKIVTEAMALSHGSIPSSNLREIKVAACHVLRSLSRSVAVLRTRLDTLDVVNGIMELLVEEPMSDSKQEEEDNLEVKGAVMATLCNLVLEFSPLKAAIMEKGMLDILVKSSHSSHEPLKLNSMWALKNIIYNSSSALKQEILEKLTVQHLIDLCNDTNMAVEEQALDFLRNTMCGSDAVINQVLSLMGEVQFFDFLTERLNPSSEYHDSPNILESAIYTLVHASASGNESHRNLISSHTVLLKRILALMSHAHPDVRLATVWLIINLTWLELQNDSESTENCKMRAVKLVELGFRDRLERLTKDPVVDVSERTKIALNQLAKLV